MRAGQHLDCRSPLLGGQARQGVGTRRDEIRGTSCYPPKKKLGGDLRSCAAGAFVALPHRPVRDKLPIDAGEARCLRLRCESFGHADDVGPACARRRDANPTKSPDKDSDKRQRAVIAAFAKAHGYFIVEEFYDAAVSGADPIAERPGFKAMLDRIAGNGVRCILVESPDRFARDLTVQLTGHDFLRKLGVALIPTTAPDFFTEDTPTAVLVRQVSGALRNSRKRRWSPNSKLRSYR
jgi:Resolvase, N terminal domain